MYESRLYPAITRRDILWLHKNDTVKYFLRKIATENVDLGPLLA